MKYDDVPILLDNSLLPCVRDCEGDTKRDCDGDSKKDCEGDNEEYFEGDSEEDREEVGEWDGKEIAGSSVNEKETISVDHELKYFKVVKISVRILYIVRVGWPQYKLKVQRLSLFSTRYCY